MMRKLIVTGYGGFVAGSVVWQALRSGRWDVCALSLIEQTEKRDRFQCIQFDLRDAAKLEKVFNEVRPNALIHAAAHADIDFCQTNQADAEEVNVSVTCMLARLCAHTGTKMIFCSTDTVFDGEKGMYREDDEPRPANFYAETKVRAEEIVRETSAQSVVTRLSLVMGLPVLGAGNSFLARMLGALERKERVTFPANEIRTPVDVITVGRALLEIAGSAFTGVIHLAGSTRVDRYEMACAIAERLGYSRELIVATDSNAMTGRARRPNDVSLDNSRARRVLTTPMRTFRDGLDLILRMKEEQAYEP